MKLQEAAYPASLQLERNNIIKQTAGFFPSVISQTVSFSAKICKVWMSCSSVQLLLWGLDKNSSPDNAGMVLLLQSPHAGAALSHRLMYVK